MDPDMIVEGDVCELIDLAEAPVSVVKNQPRFEWPSMMLFSCDQCTKLTPKFVSDDSNALFDFAWADLVGNLPPEWNHCIGYQEPKEARLYHYTMGIPCWPETDGIEDEPWKRAYFEGNSTVSWEELMGGSVHADAVRKHNAGK